MAHEPAGATEKQDFRGWPPLHDRYGSWLCENSSGRGDFNRVGDWIFPNGNVVVGHAALWGDLLSMNMATEPNMALCTIL